MKYTITVDDAFLSNFRTDDSGLTLVLTDRDGLKSLAETIKRVNASIEEANRLCTDKPKIEPIAIGQGCYKCPSHTKCLDAFQIHSHRCNHYDKTEEEFESWLKGEQS